MYPVLFNPLLCSNQLLVGYQLLFAPKYLVPSTTLRSSLGITLPQGSNSQKVDKDSLPMTLTRLHAVITAKIWLCAQIPQR